MTTLGELIDMFQTPEELTKLTFKCLYTKDRKKKKTWKDGFMVLSLQAKKVEVYEEESGRKGSMSQGSKRMKDSDWDLEYDNCVIPMGGALLLDYEDSRYNFIPPAVSTNCEDECTTASSNAESKHRTSAAPLASKTNVASQNLQQKPFSAPKKQSNPAPITSEFFSDDEYDLSDASSQSPQLPPSFKRQRL